MNKNKLSYKGYFTEIKYSEEDKVLFGKIEGIVDLVNFESDSARDIEEEFHKAVDDYLTFWKEVGKEPERAYKGSFNVRIPSKLHRDIAIYAERHGETLNSVVEKAIEIYLKNQEKPSCILNVTFQSEEKFKSVEKLWENSNWKKPQAKVLLN